MADGDRTGAARHVLRVEDTPTGDCETVIRRELMDQFLRDGHLRLIVAQGSLLAMAAMCWNHADRTLLLGWLGFGLALFAATLVLEAPYYRRKPIDTPQAQRDMLRALAPLYAAKGVLWGTPLLLYFLLDAVPRTIQSGCGLIVASMAAAPITSVALVPPLMRCFTHSLFCTLIVCLVYRIVARYGYTLDASYVVLVIPFIHWAVTVRLSRAVYQRHHTMCTLQHELTAREREARHAIETKNRLLAAATHDIRQPVAALSIFAALLIRHPDKHVQLAPKIAMATAAVNHLFDALFEHSALESDAVPVALQDVELGVLLDELHAQFETVARAKRIDLRVRHLQVVVRTDPVRLRRIIGNILANAIEYSPPASRILLAGRMHQGEPCVEVWDQGIGIEPQEIDKIFQAFYRADGGRARATEADTPAMGIGLGLSIVARLAQLLHIRIEVKSAVAKGTRFTLRLPAAAPAWPVRRCAS